MKIANKKIDVTGSIVLYHSDPIEIDHVMNCFLSSTLNVKLYLIDNSTEDTLKYLGDRNEVEYIFLGKNVGYGAAHNIALARSAQESAYHLILNPDVSFDPHVILQARNHMDQHKDVGLISPLVRYPGGTLQPMCRMLPTPFDLFARRFFPFFLKRKYEDKLDAYMLKHIDYTKQHNIPNLPGSFMFLRNTAIEIVGNFDERYFMYLEDVDLTRRINQRYITLYFPEISVVHALRQGSYFSFKLLSYHIVSAIYYFNKWGWFIDKNRRLINAPLKKRNYNVHKLILQQSPAEEHPTKVVYQ